MAKEKNNWLVLLIIVIIAIAILTLVLASLFSKNKLFDRDKEWRSILDTQISNDMERMRVALWNAAQGQNCMPRLVVCCNVQNIAIYNNTIIYSPTPGY